MSGIPCFTLKAYPPIFLNRDNVNIEAGDKIILHPDILDNLTKAYSTQLPHPIIFEIRNQKVGRTSHCGVLEFSAEERSAYLPAWMMENLCLNPGDSLLFVIKTQIPKATALKFKPLSRTFAKLPTPRETLEYALSKFTVVTEGDNITITHGNQAHVLTVTKVTPRKSDVNPAVQLLNTAVTVDFEMTDAKDGKEEEEIVFTPITLGEHKKGVVSADKCVYYRVKVVDPNLSLKITIISERGDPDIFVSTNDTPTLVKHTWSTVKSPNTVRAKNGDKTSVLMIDKDDVSFVCNWYYISIHGYKEQAHFDLCCCESEERVEETKGATVGTATNNDPNAKQCMNCLAFVPQQRFAMHELSCARNNWRCTVCNKVFRPSAKETHTHCPKCNIGLTRDALEKHLDLTHKKVACACGEELEPDVFDTHQREVCTLRLQNCKFCNMHVVTHELKQHQDFCGSKSAACDLCGKEVPRKRMSHHKASDHGINPSLPVFANHKQTRGCRHNDPPPVGGGSRAAAPSQFGRGSYGAGGGGGEMDMSELGGLGADGMQRQSSEDALQAAIAASMGDVDQQDDALQAALMASMGFAPPTSAPASRTATRTITPATATRTVTPPVRSAAPVRPEGPSQKCDYCGETVYGPYEAFVDHLAFCTAVQ